jgi:hypothetical protein
MPSAADREVITAPPTLALDLLSAMVTTSSRSRTPACSAAPGPPSPSAPNPWASVDDQTCVVPVAEPGDPGESGGLAGHRIQAVKDDRCTGPFVERGQALGEGVEAVVPEAGHRGPAGGGAGVRVAVDEQHLAGMPDDVRTVPSVP